MANVPIALQLYTVRDQTAIDFPGTVRHVAKMGYSGVEFAGTGGLSASEMQDLLAETGLKAAGSHIALALMEEDLDGVIAYNKTIGNPWIGVPFLPNELRTLDGFRQVAATLNRLGAISKAAGISLYYHNHAFEFDVQDGVRGWDILTAETDPALVGLELDCYWAVYAGEDPAALIRKNAGRFPLVHLKDMIGSGAERTWAEVGEGTIDWQPVFAASEAQGVHWYIVEQDSCARPTLESARLSITHLKKWGKG